MYLLPLGTTQLFQDVGDETSSLASMCLPARRCRGG